MAKIRKIHIENFRSIKKLTWFPSSGINCLIGHGDSGKSSVLDAIDLCLGARRGIQFTDADFLNLDVGSPIRIVITIGDLDDELKDIDMYGSFVRGFSAKENKIYDEPKVDCETVLTICLSVSSDLEASWKLISKRAEDMNLERSLNWGDRVRIAPARIGTVADYHFGWRRGSVLNKVSSDRIQASSALAKISRDARSAFGNEVQGQLNETLGVVSKTAKELGIKIGDELQALLDSASVSFGDGSISLHDENGVPLRNLGVGSARLLIAGLQRKSADTSTIIIMDEMEYGLEPHRIIRLLGSLGSKESSNPLQVFMTTHSPVALRELSGEQLFLISAGPEVHGVQCVGSSNSAQGAIRSFPEAFLGVSVIVCEGASEVGLLRGIDQYRCENGEESIFAHGTNLVDCSGGDADRIFKRAEVFLGLGYPTAVVRDDDVKPTKKSIDSFISSGGVLLVWRDNRALEEELFASLSDAAVDKLLKFAIKFVGDNLANEHIKSFTNNSSNLKSVLAEFSSSKITDSSRNMLGGVSKKQGWFKSVSRMEELAREVVAPDLKNSDKGFVELIETIFSFSAHE